MCVCVVSVCCNSSQYYSDTLKLYIQSPVNGPANSEILNQSNIHGEFYSRTNEYRSGQGLSGQGVAKTTHPYLALKLKKEYRYISTPLWAFMAFSRISFTFYLRALNVGKVRSASPC